MLAFENLGPEELGGVARAELAKGVVTPGVHAAAHRQDHGVIGPAGDLPDGAAVEGGDGERGVGEDKGAIAQLPDRILAPGPHLAILPEGQTVLGPAGHLDNPLVGKRLDEFGPEDLPHGIQADSKLAPVIEAPGEDLAVLCEGEGVDTATGHLLHPVDVQGIDRLRAKSPLGVSQLAMIIVPKTEDDKGGEGGSRVQKGGGDGKRESE